MFFLGTYALPLYKYLYIYIYIYIYIPIYIYIFNSALTYLDILRTLKLTLLLAFLHLYYDFAEGLYIKVLKSLML